MPDRPSEKTIIKGLKLDIGVMERKQRSGTINEYEEKLLKSWKRQLRELGENAKVSNM